MTDLIEQRRLEFDQVVERLRLELEQLRAEIERLTAALQEIEFHGGPAAAIARHALVGA